MSDDEAARATRSRSRGKSPPVAGADNTGNSLYAASLPLRLNKVEFEEMFSKYGPLVSCDLIEDPITHESRGFGFVVYEDKRDADDALKALHDKEVLGKRIRVEKSKRSKPHAKSPGHYLGPASASAAARAKNRSRDRNDRPRDRSRDRRSPPRYRSRDRRDRSPRHRSRDRRERSRDRDGDRRDDRPRDRSRDRRH